MLFGVWLCGHYKVNVEDEEFDTPILMPHGKIRLHEQFHLISWYVHNDFHSVLFKKKKDKKKDAHKKREAFLSD